MTTEALALVEATAAELPILAAALAEAGLPSADLGLHDRRFYGLRDQRGALVAFSALEIYGADALLRSVLVPPPQRRHGFGRALVTLTLDRASALGARRIFLLTTGAQAFFAGLGFTTIRRGEAPTRIAATAEFKSLCPETAICMTNAIARRS